MRHDFDNPYPAEYGFYRIGTPINLHLNRAAPACPAFEMSLLQRHHCLLTNVNPTRRKRIQGSGSDVKSQDAWGFSIDTSVKLNWFVHADLSCHINRSNNHATSRSTQTLTAFAKQESSMALRRNISPDLLLRCATPDFAAKLTAIRTALNAYAHSQTKGTRSALSDAYAGFYRVYGTGFVSTLVLGAIGVFRGLAEYDTTYDEVKSNYGGGVSVSGFVGGGSVAAEYSRKCVDATANGRFRGEAFGMPAGSAVGAWAEGFLNQFAGQQLSQLASLTTSWQGCFDQAVAEATPATVREDTSKEEPPSVPSFAKGEIDQQIKDLQLHELAMDWKHAHPGKTPTAEQYRAWVDGLKETARAVTADHVAAATPPSPPAEPELAGERTAGAARRLRMVTSPGPAARAGRGAHGASADVHEAFLRTGAEAAPEDDGGEVSFGDYGVVGYEYTPWHEVFPELEPIRHEISAPQVAMGLAMAWLSVREMFAQYFAFCATYFPHVAPEGIGAAANAFRAALTDMSAEMLATFDAAGAAPTLPELEQRFTERLKARRFTLTAHYDLLIRSYAWLRRLPFGAVPLASVFDEYVYQPYQTRIVNGAPVYEEGIIGDLAFPGATLLERGALRLYPIVATYDGKPLFHWANVEIVNLGHGPVTIGASLFNLSQGQAEQPDWGLCRPFGTNATYGAARDLASQLDPAASVWRLGQDGAGPAAIVVTPGTSEINMTDPLPPLPNRRVLLRSQMAPTQTFPGYSRVSDARQHLPGRPTFDVCLVPVDFDDARIATEPAGGFVGGGPMWLESRTDQILDALHALGA